jgi:mannose-1-phosphate guanylyltransferase
MRQTDYALIMAGGQGTRFWPWSTEEKPKQFLEVVGGQSLLAQTYHRLTRLILPGHIFIVAAPRYRDAVRKCLPEFSAGNYIAESAARNTAPALILANIRLSQISEDINLLVTPADHYIQDERIFSRQLKDALACADTRCIVTAGVKPSSPHTGYGYIQFNRRRYHSVRKEKFFPVEEFKEKPDEQTARTYIEKGNCYWNSGLFVYKLRFFKEFILARSPYYGDCYRRLEALRKNEKRFAAVFASIRPESIDYALMEKMDEARMFEARFGWNDVGSWSSVYEINQKNRGGNVIKGNPVVIDTSGSLVFSILDKPLAVVGLRDMAIIQTDTGLLVSQMRETQKVKQVSALLKKQKIRYENRKKGK